MPPQGPSFVDTIGVLGQQLLSMPAVTAALVAGVVALLVMIGNAIINWLLHRSKLTFDRTLARERFEFEKSIAERKTALDREIHLWKRNAEFAEQALTSFYEARNRIQAIRSPASFNSENNDRIGRDAENQAVRDARDTYYPYVRRVRDQSAFFSTFYAMRFRAAALFGLEAEQPYANMWNVVIRLKVAAERLTADAGQPAPHQRQQERHQRLEDIIWEGAADPDPVAADVMSAVETAERLFRPAIINLPR